MRIIAGQKMHPIDVPGAFLDRTDVAGAPHPVEEFFAHVHAHPARIVIKHHRQVRRAVDGQGIQRVFTFGWDRIGRGAQKDRIGSHLARTTGKGN